MTQILYIDISNETIILFSHYRAFAAKRDSPTPRSHKQGNVEDCAIVLSASNDYRQDQDSILSWAKERIVKRKEKLHTIHAKKNKLSITDVWQDYLCWVRENTGMKATAKRKEIQAFMKKYFGENWGFEYVIQLDEEENSMLC